MGGRSPNARAEKRLFCVAASIDARTYICAVRVDQAEERLRTLLSNAELDLERLEPASTWKVFKAFAAEPIEGVGPNHEDDMCLFEAGVYDWYDGKGSRFNWSLCRQFSFYDAGGEYDHMEQLRCALYFAPTSELEQLQCDGLWSGPDLAQWIAEVEGQAAFEAVMGIDPVESRVEQEQV